MNTNTSRRTETEAIVPDAVFGADGHRLASAVRPVDTRTLRQLRWMDRVMLVVAAITAILVASILAVGVGVILFVLFVVALIINAGRAIASKVRR